MNNPITPTASGSGRTHHPMILMAALAVILFCLAGVAAIMGWIPSSVGSNAANRALSDAERLALTARMQQTGTPALAASPSLPAPAPLQPVQSFAPQYQSQPMTALAPEAAPRLASRDPEPRLVQVAAAAPARNWCSNCGNIESIRPITTRAQGSGLGAAGGAVLGGLLGNQIGGGHGRQLATVAGAVGGAVVGNQVEGNMKATTSYQIRVRLDNGKYRTFHQHNAPVWHTGDRVRIVKGSLRSAN
jgi:outer membrane lipoprotein SlyB